MYFYGGIYKNAPSPAHTIASSVGRTARELPKAAIYSFLPSDWLTSHKVGLVVVELSVGEALLAPLEITFQHQYFHNTTLIDFQTSRKSSLRLE